MTQDDLGASATPTGLSPAVEPHSRLAGSAASIPSAVADVLDRAADLIEANGWIQGAYARNRKGDEASEDYAPWPRGKLCFCTMGAIDRVNGERPGTSDYTPYLRPLGFEWSWHIARWNDAPERTQAEVVAKLREAATLARETANG